jgi:hypothetical protein
MQILKRPEREADIPGKSHLSAWPLSDWQAAAP